MAAQKLVVAPPIATERQPVSREDLQEVGVDLERDFPGATVDEFKRYPVLAEGGWFMVIKHQPTLTSVSREPWDLLGPIALTSQHIEINRLIGVKTPVATEWPR